MKVLPLIALLAPLSLQVACSAQAALAETPASAQATVPPPAAGRTPPEEGMRQPPAEPAPAPPAVKEERRIVIEDDQRHIRVSGRDKAELHRALVKELGSEEEARRVEADIDKAMAQAEKERAKALKAARVERVKAQKMAREAMKRAQAELQRVQVELEANNEQLRVPPAPHFREHEDGQDLEVILDFIEDADLSADDKAAIDKALKAKKPVAKGQPPKP
ncbi:hypothetical protein PVT67_11580 [Gallaecimonas kandeliae]|uniref:hypothetical protein n=1 Tax=Gallaecimonas kandeliae TaxID=3029055 RepID=UPI00264880C0|nr:hypothetical protein [Gallaecimonas kandeliae]WKE64320.1 hypothetical protein PVT67_11580 [Gallaecimonas kandeliae]